MEGRANVGIKKYQYPFIKTVILFLNFIYVVCLSLQRKMYVRPEVLDMDG